MNQVTGGCTVTFTTPKKTVPNSTPILYLRITLKNTEPEMQTLSREVLDVALNTLGKIVDLYRNQRDPLSVKLIDWGLKVLLNDQFKERFDEGYIASFVKKIHVLSQKILINDLDNAPLESPLMVEDLIWEEWMWEDFQGSCPQPPQETTKHHFAQAMIAWRNSLPITKINPTIEISDPDFQPLKAIIPPQTSGMLVRELCEANVDDVSKALKTARYCNLKFIAHRIQEEGTKQEGSIEGAEELRELWEQARKNIAAQAELAEQEAKAHTERLKQSLHHIHQAHQQTVQILNSLIEQQRAFQSKLTAKIEANERRMSLQEGQIWQLRNQLANQWASIHRLEKKAKKKRKWF